jgi:hypothetical protein
VNLVTGSHITDGVRITNGIDLMNGTKATVASASWSVLSSKSSINSKNIALTAAKGIDMNAANAISLAAGTVQLSGASININGRDWDSSATTWDLKKSFDTFHPTKEGWRLRYVCLEGPDADVYIKGKLKDSNVIYLPSYWSEFVNPETINVVLTPIGTYQELFVEKIENGSRVIVKNSGGGPIHCYYQIIAERVDVEKNIPEYKGLTPMDYPGDNSKYSINGR